MVIKCGNWTDNEDTSAIISESHRKLKCKATLLCHSQILEFLQGLLRREYIDQTDDLQTERQAISSLCFFPIYIYFRMEKRKPEESKTLMGLCGF